MRVKMLDFYRKTYKFRFFDKYLNNCKQHVTTVMISIERKFGIAFNDIESCITVL